MANQIIEKVSEFEIDNIEIDFIIEEEPLWYCWLSILSAGRIYVMS